MTATHVRSFLDVVGDELADLPEPQRTDLLEDLAGHLREVEAEGDLYETLGDPVAYARELRAAAGMERAIGAVREPLLTQVRERVGLALRSPRARSVRSFLGELRPAWWVARGWIAVCAFGGLLRLFPRVRGSLFLGLLLVVGSAVVSVRLAQRALGGRLVWVNRLASVAALLLLLTLPRVQVVYQKTEAFWIDGAGGGRFRITSVSNGPDGSLVLDAECPGSAGPVNYSVEGNTIRCWRYFSSPLVVRPPSTVPPRFASTTIGGLPPTLPSITTLQPVAPTSPIPPTTTGS